MRVLGVMVWNDPSPQPSPRKDGEREAEEAPQRLCQWKKRAEGYSRPLRFETLASQQETTSSRWRTCGCPSRTTEPLPRDHLKRRQCLRPSTALRPPAWPMPCRQQRLQHVRESRDRRYCHLAIRIHCGFCLGDSLFWDTSVAGCLFPILRGRRLLRNHCAADQREVTPHTPIPTTAIESATITAHVRMPRESPLGRFRQQSFG